jgi:predicted nucleic acid-binding protein
MARSKDILIVDTSVFVQENFLEGARINTILNLSERKHFQLVLSEITVKEIKAQFKKRVSAAIIKHNELINDKKNDVRVLRNNPKGKLIIQKLPNEKTICSEFNDALDKELADAGATILPYPTLNIGEVFEDYFNGKPPFGHGDKKQEFPDAFVIVHIEQWCKENGVTATILSKDKDFLSRTSPHCKVVFEYEKFIQEKLKEIETKRTDRLDILYKAKSAAIDKDIIGWLEDEFANDTVFDDITNWMDVHDLDVEYINVVCKEYEIIGDDKENLEIEVTATVSYKAKLEIDDAETGSYDKEDGIVLFRETTEITIEEHDLKIPLKINFYIPEPDDFDDDYEVLEINDSKDVKLSADGYYHDYY